VSKEKKAASQKRYIEKNKEAYSAYQKEYHKEYSKKRKAEREKRKAEREKNKVILSEEEKQKIEEVRQERKKQKRKEWVENNREKMSAQQREYTAQRKAEDPFFRATLNIKNRTRSAFKNGYSKSKHTAELIGCSWEELREYLESQFIDGMTWDNNTFYGWHVDHIIPLASAKTLEELELLCHYTNLQPLWAQDNLKKGDSLPD
jgi:hypothetical protein